MHLWRADLTYSHYFVYSKDLKFQMLPNGGACWERLPILSRSRLLVKSNMVRFELEFHGWNVLAHQPRTQVSVTENILMFHNKWGWVGFRIHHFRLLLKRKLCSRIQPENNQHRDSHESDWYQRSCLCTLLMVLLKQILNENLRWLDLKETSAWIIGIPGI